LAPRPGASESPARRWERKRLAHLRTTVRWTPSEPATADWACPSAKRRIIFPRRASPAVIVVERCQCSKVSRSSEDRRMRNEDLRPRAIALSSQQ